MEHTAAQNNNDCVILEGKDVWPNEVKEHLIDLMVDEVNKGNRTTTTFSKTGWANIKNGLKIKFRKEWTDDQLKNKYNQLRRKQRVFKTMVSETGVGYINDTGKIEATNEHWERWLKMDKVAASIKKYGCPEYRKLCIIYGDTTATGGEALASTKEVVDSSSEDQSKEEDNGVNVRKKATELPKESQDKAKSKGKKRKAVKSSFSSTIEKAIVDMAEESKRKNDMRLASQVNSSIGCAMNEISSHDEELDIMTGCMNVLDELEVDGDVFAKSFNALHDYPLKRKLFLRMSAKRRMDWLMSLP